jgi:hypothetical protein
LNTQISSASWIVAYLRTGSSAILAAGPLKAANPALRPPRDRFSLKAPAQPVP